MFKFLIFLGLFFSNSVFAGANAQVSIPNLGEMHIIMQNSAQGTPVALIQDTRGKYYPEIQFEINQAIKSKSLIGFNPTDIKVVREMEIYKESDRSYITLVVEGITKNGLTKSNQNLIFTIPIQRMWLKLSGINTQGFGYWNNTQVRIYDNK